MKILKVTAAKNQVSEVFTYLHPKNKEVLSLTRRFSDGEFLVRIPESRNEENELLSEIWADPSGRKYPGIITKESKQVDLSEYSHEMIRLGSSSDLWKVERDGKDLSNKFKDLLVQLTNMNSSDYDEALEELGWDIDEQYYLLDAIARVTSN